MFVNNYLTQQNICYGRGPFLIGGGQPSKGIRAIENYLYDVNMRIGYNAPYNEDCEVRDNVIVNGGLEIIRYRSATQSENLIIGKGGPRPKGSKIVLLPNKYKQNRAHLVVFNWEGLEEVDVPVDGFFADGERFRLMNPQDVFGEVVCEGICQGGIIGAPMRGEFGVFVVLRSG